MRSGDVERAEDVDDLAATLIQQAERCSRAGLVDQATAILQQVWTIALADAPGLADTAAWRIAWLALCREDFAAAATWFERVSAPPTLERHWPQIRGALVQLCRGRIEPAAPSQPLPPLQITSLGCFQIARDHQPLPTCNARKAIAIFRYLLTRPFHTASKEELMELLWPTASPAKAAHNLQVAVSALRRYLDVEQGSYVLWDHGSYRLAPAAALHDDSLALLQLFSDAERAWNADQLDQAQTRYAKVIDGYSGDYYVDDADGAWAIAERERLLTCYLVALERLGNLHQLHERYEAAIACYLRLVERDTFREDVFCQLMRCFGQLGRRSDVVRQYQRIAETLRDELGLEPSPETQALHQALVGAAALALAR
jgi:DNA-binding SARP family transcriptional activator